MEGQGPSSAGHENDFFSVGEWTRIETTEGIVVLQPSSSVNAASTEHLNELYREGHSVLGRYVDTEL